MFGVGRWRRAQKFKNSKEHVDRVSNSQQVHCFKIVCIFFVLRLWEAKNDQADHEQGQVEHRVSAHQVQSSEWLF